MAKPQVKPVLKEETALLKSITVGDLDLVRNLNRQYHHWKEIEYRIGNADRDTIWSIMKLLRRNDSNQLRLRGCSFSYSMIDDFLRSLHGIDVKSSSSGFMPREILSNSLMDMYLISSLMEESISSSQIEGAATSTESAKKMLRSGKAPTNRDERMIFNNYMAMRFIKENVSRDLTDGLILDIHRIISKGTIDDPEYEGRYRDNNDIVVGDSYSYDIVHEPIPFDDIPQAIQDLCDFVNREDGPFIHPIIKGIIIHFLIGYFHPFVDGNGRLARSLFYWYCLKNGYWTMEYLAISKVIKERKTRYDESYIYAESDENDITYFIRFNLRCIEDSIGNFMEYVKKKIEEQKEAAKIIREGSNLNIRQRSILTDVMKAGNFFTISEIEREYGVSYQTARADINRLIDGGYIVKAGRDGYNIIYTAANLESIIGTAKRT